MEIIGTCLNCFPPSGCLLVNCAAALAILGFAIWRGNLGGLPR